MSSKDISEKLNKVSGNLFNRLVDLKKYIEEQLASILHIIVNSEKYKYYISILLTLVFILLVILINLSKVSEKNTQLIILSVGGILLSFFYFFVYRNEQEDNRGFAVLGPNLTGSFKSIYSEDKKKLVKEIKNKEGQDKKVFNIENFNNTIKNPIKNLLKFSGFYIGLILLVIFLIVTIYNGYNTYQYLYFGTKVFIGILIGISILSILAKIFETQLTDCDNSDINLLNKFLCLIKNFIMFLPCLLVIIVDEINKDIKATPSSIYLLFIILLFLVLSFIGLPLLFQLVANLNKHDLLSGKGPYYLDEKRTIGKYQDFSKNFKSTTNKIIKPGTTYSLLDESPEQEFNIKALIGNLGKNKLEYKYTYSISFYLYLNPQPENTSIAYTRETELFNYANKPVILYDGKSRKLIIKSKSQTSEGSQLDTIYKTKNIKYQKWMFITINYQNNIIDVFIDGKLVGSKKNVPPFFDDDKITIGEDNGIHGSIKEIYYYETPRPVSDIEFMYDLTINSEKD